MVDIKGIPEVNELTYGAAQGLTIGAAVPCYRIYDHQEIAAAYPGLIDAFSLIGGTAIQGRASVGGNLCNASPAADTIPALIVHETTCVIAGPNGAGARGRQLHGGTLGAGYGCLEAPDLGVEDVNLIRAPDRGMERHQSAKYPQRGHHREPPAAQP